jgi:uncharacterized protein HemX
LKKQFDSGLDLQKIADDLRQMENTVTQSELRGKVELQKTQSDISQTEARIAQLEAKIGQSEAREGGQYFTIFGLMAAVALGLGGIAIWVVQKVATDNVIRRAQDFVKDEVEKAQRLLHQNAAAFASKCRPGTR